MVMLKDGVDNLPRTLILDADDSYTRNILDLILQVYPIDSSQLNSRVLLVRANDYDWDTLSTQIIPHFAAIILGPGPGRPASDSLEHPASIFTRIFSPNTLPSLCGHHIPTLGICLGHQALGFAYGAAVKPAPQVLHGQLCRLELELDNLGKGKGVLNLLDQGTHVVRYNSLTVDPLSISQELDITAWAQDGSSRTVMGLAHKTLPFHSVQFHPESVCSINGTQILRSFFEMVSKSSYVNSQSGLGSLAAYSPLPDHMLKYSDMIIHRNPAQGLRSSHFSFQLRSFVIKSSHLTPEDVFQGFLEGINQLGHVWLDSADSQTCRNTQKRCSHMGTVDLLISYFASQKKLSITKCRESCDQSLSDTSFWAWLQQAQVMLQASTEILPISEPTWNSSHPSNLPFTDARPVKDQRRAPVGFMGYINYELLSESLAKYKLPCRSTSTTIPDAELGFCNTALTYDHSTSTWTTSALVLLNNQSSSSNNLLQNFGFSVGLTEMEYLDWNKRVEQIFKTPPKTCQSIELNYHHSNEPILNPCLEPIVSETDYLLAISKAQDQITAGESYELCLTTQFRGNLSGSQSHNHFERYLALRKANPAPYGAYIHFAPYDTNILSSSPERFMSIDCNSRVEMKPIKGTARRNLTDPKIDQEISQKLEQDTKERAENLMITDLIRHDLLGFCETGSVQVTKLFGIETVATVHSLVSTVVGVLQPGLNAVDALCSAFPPGSMTGAPKISSIEILDRLEFHQPRGTYSGMLGFIAVDGSSDMSVVIRTAIIRGSSVSVGGGGAITSLSKKEDEWNEVKLKIEAVQRNLNLV